MTAVGPKLFHPRLDTGRLNGPAETTDPEAS
jgi:hypothetical protein